MKSVKEKDGGKENLDTEKREKKILHRIEKIERTEKVELQEKVLLNSTLRAKIERFILTFIVVSSRPSARRYSSTKGRWTVPWISTPRRNFQD